MHRFATKRRIRAVGKAAYIAIPKLARLELGLFVNDEVILELDTKRKTIVLRKAEARTIPPMIDLDQLEMLPGRREELEAPAAAEASTPEAIAVKVPA